VTLRIQSLRVPAAALALVVLSAFAVGAATDAAADEARVTIHRVTIPAAHFVPVEDTDSYENDGDKLSPTTGSASFAAPIPYSYDGTDHIFITRVELLAYDNDAVGQVCLDVFRAEPANATESAMGWACTDDSMTDPQSLLSIPHTRRVNAGQRAYLWVYLGSPNVSLYGVRVTYTTNP